MRQYAIRLVFMDLETRIEIGKNYTVEEESNAKAVIKLLDSLSVEERDSVFEVGISYFK